MCGILGLGLSPECLLIGFIVWALKIIVPLGMMLGGVWLMARGRTTIGLFSVVIGLALFIFFTFGG